MKKPLLLLSMSILLAISCAAQKSSFGFNLAIGNGFIMHQALDGSASYDLKHSLTLGIHYEKQFAKKLHAGAELNLFSSTIQITPNYYPGIDRTPKQNNARLVYIPVFLRLDIAKYLFVNLQHFADIDISKNSSITNQSGFGTGLGFGAEFPITESFHLVVNPYVNFHGLLLTRSETYPKRIIDSGIKLIFLHKQKR